MNTNHKIADIFVNISNILEILGENPFKSRAYRNAASSILELKTDIEELAVDKKLTDIKGVGKDLADKINEYIATGSIAYYEELDKKVPRSFLHLLKIRGIGTGFLSMIYKYHNIRTLDELEDLINGKDALQIKGLGKKKINELNTNISHYKENIGKVGLGTALPMAEFIISEIKRISPGSRPCIAGSVRRMKETVGSIDLLCIKNDQIRITDELSKLDFLSLDSHDQETHAVYKSGNDIKIKLTFCDGSSFGSSLLFLTGSKEHNDKINNIASENELILNSSGLFRNNMQIAGRDEADIYKKLGIDYIEPELRENTGEIELSLEGTLPNLIEISDIRGDIHTHSTWSDGRSSVSEMVKAAIEIGYEYIAITDHSPSSVIANGLDIKRLMQKKKEVEELDKNTDRIKVFMGAEVDIRKDGSLDYSDDILSQLDIVIASVHSSFNMSKGDMTKRIIKALKNPFVHILGHPTGRLVAERKAYELDIDAVIDAARDYGKVLEINSSYKRLDLRDTHIKKAIGKGVKLSICTDAHNTDQLLNIKYGIGTARRGFVKRQDILNTVDRDTIISWLKGFKSRS